jgi:lipoyl(octanoyl) transferase
VLLTSPLSGAHNMALDHALMRRAIRTGEAVLRIYSWREPTLSFGRHQVAAGVYDRDTIRAAGLAVVRRPTGGRAVLHDDEITYSVTAPLPSDRGPATSVGDTRRSRARALYTAINHVLLAALRRIGVAAELAPRGALASGAPAPTATPCFDTATDGELVVRGRKLVGSAQWREAGAVLQHGSILIADHRARLVALAPTCTPAAAPAAALRDLMDRIPSPTEMAAALGGALDDALSAARATPARVISMDTETEAMALTLRGRYEDDGWTWRR